MKKPLVLTGAILSIVIILTSQYFLSIQSNIEETPPSEMGNHLTLKETTATTYTVEVRNIPLEKSTLNCDSTNTGVADVKFNFIKTYGVGESISDENSTGKINNTDIVKIEDIASEVEFYCILFASGTILDELRFSIDGDGAEHTITSLSLSNDWDHLTAHWNSSHEVMWERVELRLESEPAYHNTRMGENGSAYLGGIPDGTWFLSISATDMEGDLNELEWFSFYYDGKACDEINTTCPSLIELTPSEGPNTNSMVLL